MLITLFQNRENTALKRLLRKISTFVILVEQENFSNLRGYNFSPPKSCPILSRTLSKNISTFG